MTIHVSSAVQMATLPPILIKLAQCVHRIVKHVFKVTTNAQNARIHKFYKIVFV